MNAPRSPGLLVVGLEPRRNFGVVDQAARLARESGRHIVFAYVELNSALIEQENSGLRLRMSLDPPVDDEMASITSELRTRLGDSEALAGVTWTLRVLGGDPAQALDRLAQRVDASLIVVGGPRRGVAHRAESLLTGSVSGWLARNQKRPVLVVPD